MKQSVGTSSRTVFRLVRSISIIIAGIAISLSAAPAQTPRSPAAAAGNPDNVFLQRNASKAEAHLRQLFGNQKLSVVLRAPGLAELRLGDAPLGKMTADADEEALTASVEIPASEMAGENKPDLKKAEAYLRRLLGAANLRVVDSKGSAEVHLGDEFAGVIRMDDRKAGVFELAILALDLEEASGAPGAPRAADKATDIEPVDSLNSTYFARTAQVAVRERPSEDAPIVTQFPEDQRVKVTGKLRNSSRSDERWYQIEFSDGTPRFVRGKDLLSEKTYRYKLQYKVLLNSYESNLQQIGNSQGKLARYMGFYTLGQDCQLQPFQVKKVKGFEGANALSQREKDVFWGSTSYALWTDGTHVFRSSVENGRMMRYKPTFINTKKYKNIGAIQLYRLDRIDPPGVDADLAVTGFAENGKLLVDVKLDGSNIQFKWATRCNDRSRVKDALAEHYKKAIEGLTIDF